MSNKLFFSIAALMIAGVLFMSFTLHKPETSPEVVTMSVDDNGTNCCCPPHFHPVPLEGDDDPAAHYDNNADGWICWKPVNNGHGNDPLYDNGVVKDNNQPCHIDNKIPDHEHTGPCEGL
jgi:hypothetical protein